MKQHHIIGVCQTLGPVLGGCANDRRQEKYGDGIARMVKAVVNEAATGANGASKGLVLSDCNLTPQDMSYLSTHFALSNYTFDLVDFSYNHQLRAQGLDYLIKGQEGINHLNMAQTAANNYAQGKPMMLMEMLQSMMAQAQTINPDDYTFKGLLTRSNFNFHKLDLSGCNIGDAGMDILAHALSNGRLPSLKHIDISGNGISLPKINQFLNQISQEMFLITEKAYDNGKAIFKDANSGSLYDMVIKSEGRDATIEFADGTTGISGVSAGDTCPPSVREQMAYCLGGATGTMIARWETCSKAPGQAKLVCLSGAFLTGCAGGVAAKSVTECANGREYEGWDVDATPLSGVTHIDWYHWGNSGVTHSTDIDWYHWGNSGESVSDRGDFSFSATGGTEIGPTSIDNDNGLSGSNFDLSQHDF